LAVSTGFIFLFENLQAQFHAIATNPAIFLTNNAQVHLWISEAEITFLLQWVVPLRYGYIRQNFDAGIDAFNANGYRRPVDNIFNLIRNPLAERTCNGSVRRAGRSNGVNQLGPAIKTVLSCYDVLGVLQRELCDKAVRFRDPGQLWMEVFDALKGLRVGLLAGFEKNFRLFLEMLKIGLRWKLFRHKNTLFLVCA
jgi:hypothetical protein